MCVREREKKKECVCVSRVYDCRKISAIVLISLNEELYVLPCLSSNKKVSSIKTEFYFDMAGTGTQAVSIFTQSFSVLTNSCINLDQSKQHSKMNCHTTFSSVSNVKIRKIFILISPNNIRK